MNEVEVTIKVYSDELYFNQIKTLTCDVEVEYDSDGNMTYAYGWDITIGDTIEENCDKDEWKRAFAFSNSSQSVDEFFNDDGEVINIHARSPDEKFIPFVILLGDSQVQGFESIFSGKKTISKSPQNLDKYFSKLYSHPERITLFINEILGQQKINLKHLDVVFEPEINSLQMLQWNEHYKFMFYITERGDFYDFVKVSRQFDTYKEVENSLDFILNEVDSSSKQIIDDFITQLSVLRGNSMGNLLNISLARRKLD